MKALSLWEPWATLIAIGEKTIETRSWSTDYRGELAIHAAARSPEVVILGDWCARRTCKKPETWALDHFGVDGRVDRVLPLTPGLVVATCRLVDVITTGSVLDVDGVDEEEAKRNLPYGDFTPGRFAWVLRDVTPLDVPVLAKGRQQLWEWAA